MLGGPGWLWEDPKVYVESPACNGRSNIWLAIVKEQITLQGAGFKQKMSAPAVEGTSMNSRFSSEAGRWLGSPWPRIYNSLFNVST